MRREQSFAYNDKTLDESPYNRARRDGSFNRGEGRNGSGGGGGGYTPTLLTRQPRREKTFYKASNFRDSSPGGREYSGATNRSHASVSIRTHNSTHSGGSGGYSREGSIIRSTLSVTNGIPDVPLIESPRITTTAGSFRLDYDERNKLSFRKIIKPEPPIEFIRIGSSGGGKFARYTHDDLVKIRSLTAPPSPPFMLLRNRERSFVNDAIVTTSQRTKYKDTLLTPYDSKMDIHTKSYIQRPDIQRLLSETYSVKPGDRDVKRKYLNQEASYYDNLY